MYRVRENPVKSQISSLPWPMTALMHIGELDGTWSKGSVCYQLACCNNNCNNYMHIWSFHWNTSLKETVSHSASSYSHKCLWHYQCACAFCTCWLLPCSPRMHRQGKLIWQDAWSQLASLVQTISLCSKTRRKGWKIRAIQLPLAPSREKGQPCLWDNAGKWQSSTARELWYGLQQSVSSASVQVSSPA